MDMFRRHFLRLALAGIFIAAGQLHAAPVPTDSKAVVLKVAKGGKFASVLVPKGCDRVVIQRSDKRLRAGTWSTLSTTVVPPGASVVRVDLPGGLRNFRWRAYALRSGDPDTVAKYPALFYKGRSSFPNGTISDAYASSSSGPVFGIMDSVVAASPSVQDSSASAAKTPEEADLWKIDGNTIYVFNELRGLQVIDITDPANPALTASLRIPGKGQDLYAVKGSDGVSRVILLTADYSSGTAGVLLKLVRVENGKASVEQEVPLKGWLSDSRVIGQRLFVATSLWDYSAEGGRSRSTLSVLTISPETGALSLENAVDLPGSCSFLAAGQGWLAAVTTNGTDWQSSVVSAFRVSDDSVQPFGKPVTASGSVYDQYKVDVWNDVIRLVTVRWEDGKPQPGAFWTPRVPVTSLENYSAAGDRLSSLELVRGEQLHATRFAQDKAYVVTFFQIDPLWVLDLSDPEAPFVAGELQVPGWSTFIEPVGSDRLFAIGFENGRVTASIFGVSDPANPTLVSRLNVGENWGYSEATWEPKALKVFGDEKLALIPYSSPGGDGASHRVQLVDWDESGALSLRGAIVHDFEPRRSALVDGILASISQRQLITAKIDDRDHPAVLADLALAWPVDRVFASGDYLLQIADGTSWMGTGAAAYISKIGDPDSIVGELPLGEGSIRDALLDGNRLFVLRQNPAPFFGWWCRPVWSGGGGSGDPTVFLDVYDASNLPELKLTGTASRVLPQGGFSTSRLLRVSPDLVAAIVDPAPRFWWPGPVMMPVAIDLKAEVARRCAVAPALRRASGSSFAIPFQVGDSAPVVTDSIPLGTTGSAPCYVTAGDGLLIFGFAEGEKVSSRAGRSLANHRMGIIDFQNPSAPVSRPAIDLPGRLISVSDLSRNGFLAWTRTYDSRDAGAVQVGASDGWNYFFVSSLATSDPVDTNGRDLSIATSNGVKAFTLDDTGTLTLKKSIPLDWTPTSIRSLSGGILATDGSRLLRAAWDSSDAATDWPLDFWTDLSKVTPLGDASVVVPFGVYGAERLDP